MDNFNVAGVLARLPDQKVLLPPEEAVCSPRAAQGKQRVADLLADPLHFVFFNLGY